MRPFLDAGLIVKHGTAKTRSVLERAQRLVAALGNKKNYISISARCRADEQHKFKDFRKPASHQFHTSRCFSFCSLGPPRYVTPHVSCGNGTKCEFLPTSPHSLSVPSVIPPFVGGNFPRNTPLTKCHSGQTKCEKNPAPPETHIRAVLNPNPTFHRSLLWRGSRNEFWGSESGSARFCRLKRNGGIFYSTGLSELEQEASAGNSPLPCLHRARVVFSVLFFAPLVSGCKPNAG
jgi:hypothetical protein